MQYPFVGVLAACVETETSSALVSDILEIAGFDVGSDLPTGPALDEILRELHPCVRRELLKEMAR